MAVVLAMLCALMTGALPATAQSDAVSADQPPLVAAIGPFPPYFFQDNDGVWTGFSVELLREVSREIGLDIEFKPTANASELVSALINGEADTIPGVAMLPVFGDTVIYSDAVVSETLRLIALPDRARDLTGVAVEGLRIGIIPPAAGSDITELLARNTPVDFATLDAALVAVLAGDVDAILLPNAVAYTRIRNAGIDHLFRFVDPPVRTLDRFIPLRKERADLLPAINAALARLKADGRLETLTRQYAIDVPPPPPEVLSVGVAEFPPYNIYNADGSFSGFSVETIRDLADLADVKIEFVAITQEEFGAGPTARTFDMVSQAGINPERLTRMDFTAPLERFEFSFFTRAGDADGVSDLNSLGGRTIGVLRSNLAERFVDNHGGLDVVRYDQLPALIDGLESGAVDVILFPRRGAHAEIQRRGIEAKIDEVTPPFRIIKRAPALRFGLGAIRERLNAVIPGYLLSEDYAALRQKYLAEPVFWTRQRITFVLACFGAALLVLLVMVLWQRQQQRHLAFVSQQKELAREKAHGEKMGALVDELTRSNRDLDDFAYIASHDLKEPLRGIGINANFLMREDLPEKGREHAVRMSELAGQMEKLISDLLYFSRLGRGDSARVMVSPHDTIQSIRADLGEWLTERNAQIVEMGKIPSLEVERAKFKTVMQNLITNAVKYNDADEKRIEIGYTAEALVHGDLMRDVIYVKDNGIGISETHRDKVFRIFSRLNAKQKYDSGSGSGLTFVRKIVEAHGGKISFESTLGNGTTFYVSLPLAGPLANETTGDAA